ncbi:hypothetical protein GGH91_001022 [Coemansia sp. RSA 2671]|nr:hypothetical protein LPJ60_001968 [Coemansia sp. RSA 2675]KAJ2349079.1 hypothetical protein GGH91_001022 [Coemansia sp. RSA 2671]
MRTLSAFQLLPSHIVRLIVDHVSGSSRIRFSGVGLHSDLGRELEMPLLWVCHNFRDFVYRRYCRQYELDLASNPGETVVKHTSWPKRLQKVDHETNLLATELTIHLGVRDIYAGKSLQLLSQAPYVGCAFPLVRKLSFDILACNVPKLVKDYPPNTEANIVVFVQRIKEMAPATSEVYVTNDDELGKLLQRKNACLADLIKRLFETMETTTISFYDSLKFDCIDKENIRNLVRLKCSTHRQEDMVLSLVRRNAQTLRAIDIFAFAAFDFTGVVRNPDDGKYLEYPCLHRLKFISPNHTLVSKPSPLEGAVPFPCLRFLQLECDYPFGDDVIFRGNSSTLEYLALVPSVKLVEALGRYKVFTPTSHPKLGCVVIEVLSNFSRRAFDSADAYLRFALSIAPGASVRVVPSLSRYGVDISPELPRLYGHVSIQVLHLVGTDISLLGAIALIKALPLLSDLNVSAPTLGELSESFQEDELPDHLRTTYAPMGRRLRCLYIYNKCNFNDLATCMLLLALICPNFDYVVVTSAYRGMLMEAMRKRIEKPLFSNYAPRLRRLLFNGWNGKQG